IKECMIGCDLVYPMTDIRNSTDHVGDPALEGKIITSVTGRDFEKEPLLKIGERVFNLQRAILLREGRRPEKDDLLPEEWHTKPLESHVADPECLAPDKKGNAISRKGAIIDMDGYKKMRKEYYILRGWDKNSGLQTREKLNELGLGDITASLDENGFISG
ncbi:aldehyde ferredoxin oxidoreductase C-terminal domain-containing protein, partial [Spirochaetota bacterium]